MKCFGLFLIVIVSFAKAQNLIPDSSFEQNKVIPTDFSAINQSNYWNMPTQGTTDLFCICNRKQYETIDVPETEIPVQTELDTLDQIPADTHLVFKNVQFQSNKAALLPSSYTDLDKIVSYLQKNTGIHIQIEGHSDNTGNDYINQKLSENRAKAIAAYLIKNDIDKQRIVTKGYGSTKPLVSNNSPENRKKNRRVEFVLKKP